MTPLDAMKQALEALEEANPNLSPNGRADRLVNEAITTLRTILASPPKEPVAWEYRLMLNGEELNRECSHVNWDIRYRPFGRPNIDYNRECTVEMKPLYTKDDQ